ncbi:hypothetical protein BDV3_006610 [Batrachochytrium dendrobatidis]
MTLSAVNAISTKSKSTAAIQKLNYVSGAAMNDLSVHANQPPPPMYPDHSEEEQEKDARLRSFLDDNPHIILSMSEFRNLRTLPSNHAIQFLNDIKDAIEGTIVPPPFGPQSAPASLGMVNIGNSCYIDALLFAMFACGTAFDGLMDAPTLDTGDEMDYSMKRFLRFSLESSIRLIVNRLRKGQLVDKIYVARFRKALAELGWFGENKDNVGLQQDTSELFLFLMNTLGAPFLPLQSEIFHGAHSSCDDLRIFTERIIQLSIPSTVSHVSVLLEDMLEDHFFSNMVQIKRRSESSLDSTSSTNAEHTLSNDASHLESGSRPTHLKHIEAWQSSRVLPFLTPECETGDPSRNIPQSQTRPITIPFMIKRFSYDVRSGQTVRIGRRVYIPTEIPFGDFIVHNANPTGTDKQDHLGVNRNYCLRLRSILCHEGEHTLGEPMNVLESLGTPMTVGSLPTMSASLSSTSLDSSDTIKVETLLNELGRSSTFESFSTKSTMRSNGTKPRLGPTSLSRSLSCAPSTPSFNSKSEVLPESMHWLHFDDNMISGRVKVLSTQQAIANAFNHASLNAYMVFYELCIPDFPVLQAAYPFVVEPPPRRKSSKRCTIL